jgi:HD-GYP domain-containing protein (c-di-GMP phosphodiesterase class II)
MRMPESAGPDKQDITVDLDAVPTAEAEDAAGLTRAHGDPLDEYPNAETRTPEDAYVSVRQFRQRLLGSLHSGMTLSEDIYDESGVLLLAAGSLITTRFLQILRERGITQVRLRPAYAHPVAEAICNPSQPLTEDGLQTLRSRELDERMAGELQRQVFFRPVKAWRRPRRSVEALKNEASRGIERHAATAAAVVELCETLRAGRGGSAGKLRQSIGQFVNIATTDFDLLPLIVALKQSNDEYLYDHCVNVALLSMAIAFQLGLHHGEITMIGLAGLLHDIGMLRVPPSVRLAQRPLSDQERHEIRRHPLHTLDMLAGIRGVPSTVRFVAYQVHERPDGSGYPRGRTYREIHKFAGIVSMADVFAAMTRPRPYRPAMGPYAAARSILFEGANAHFDRAMVRALLDTVSLFPIGSRVELSNGAAARVLRANPSLHTRPVVEELTKDGCATGHVIDLSHDGAPSVIRAS